MDISETVNFYGVIEVDGEVIAQATATIESDTGATTSYSESINNYEKYVENKKDCREQFDDFRKKVYEKEDQIQTEYPGVEDVL